jgi:glycolate oxidase FAD binding subunit
MRKLARTNFPVTGTCYLEGKLYVRLSGEPTSLRKAWDNIDGQPVEQDNTFWDLIREQSMDFFGGAGDLWRLSVPPSVALSEDKEVLVEWGGAQRWYRDADERWARSTAENLGGHATLFRARRSSCARFQPLEQGIRKLHQRLKHAFDPSGVLNPGRMYADF